jgi:hypothetical protein
MSKWRKFVIPALLLFTFHNMPGQELPAPVLSPHSGELNCPATINIKEDVPNAVIVKTTDGSQPSPDMAAGYFGVELVSNSWMIPITKTTTVRTIAVSTEYIFRVSVESAATYICRNVSTPHGLPNSAQSAQTASDVAGQIDRPTAAKSRWFWLLIIGIAILLAVVLSSLTLHLIYLRKVGRELFPSLSRLRISSTTMEDVRRAVDQRTQEIGLFLREFDNEGGALVEFLETPPGLPGIERRRFARDDPARFWHASRLSFELEDNAYLLLERVTDAIVSFARTGALEHSALPTAIQLEKASRSKEKFPWRVVITSADRKRLHALLSNPETSRWCGIDIEIRSPIQSLKTQGRCRQGPDGMEGVIGGVFEDVRSGERYGVTCAHVLSSACPASFWSGGKPRTMPKEYVAERPDAAFIKGITACFGVPPTHEQEVAVASLKDVVTYLQNKTSLRKTPSDDDTPGVIQQGLGSLFMLDDVTYRGPHFVIAPKFHKQLGVVFPRSGRFSSQGDSGCWVTTEDKRWLGMIVGAFTPPNTTSLAIHGRHLLNAFSRSQSASIPRSAIKAKANAR